jgi:serine phosphatase RsbU (regulator of sigma subunit)
VEELIMEGMPLGSSSLANYREYFTDLEPGDILLLSSDGLPESVDGSERLLGYDAVQESFRKAAARGGDAGAMCDALLQEAMSWSGKETPDDDVTVLVVRVRTA